MSTLKELREISVAQAAAGLLGFSGMVAPGILTLYYYRHEDFVALDSLAILLLAGSLTLPPSITVLFAIRFFTSVKEFRSAFWIASHLCSVSAYGALFASYNTGLDFKRFAALFCIICLVVFLICLRVFKIKELKNEKSSG